MTQTATSISDPQRRRALERANEVRLARACLKRRIAIGEVSAAEIILGCPAEATSWTVGELLMSQRRWGGTRCRKFLGRNEIGENKPIGKLTERQRLLLAAALAPGAVEEMQRAAQDRPQGVARETSQPVSRVTEEHLTQETEEPLTQEIGERAAQEMALVGA